MKASMLLGIGLTMLALCSGCRLGDAHHRTGSGKRTQGELGAAMDAVSTDASRSSASLDAIASLYVRAVLALGERDPDSLDFAAVDPDLKSRVHAEYAPTAEVRSAADTAVQALTQMLGRSKLAVSDEFRARFLLLQFRSLGARALMLHGATHNFDSESKMLFDVTQQPDTHASERALLRKRIAGLLPAPVARTREPSSRDDDHSLAARYAAYDRQFLVPPQRLGAVMTAALASCRSATLAHMALPAGESVDLAFVRNQPWSAFSQYRGHAHSTIKINLDLPVTVDDVLELACHEGYPGHHVFNSLREQALVERKHQAEMEVQPTFSPQSYVSEAAAAYAPRLAFSPDERAAVERDKLFPLAGLPVSAANRYVLVSTLIRGLDSAEPAIAREYLDGQLEFVRAEDRLADEMLMAHAEPSLLYLNEYRTYMLAYTDGPRSIAAYLGDAVSCDTRSPSQAAAAWQRYQHLMQALVYQLPPPDTSLQGKTCR